MRTLGFAVAFVVPTLMLLGLAGADDKKANDKDKGDPVTALAPSPLDNAFEKATSEREITNNLLNNDLYNKAVKAALKAKKDQEQRYKDNPKLVGSTPAQAAREAFLKVLRNEADDTPKDKDKDKEKDK